MYSGGSAVFDSSPTVNTYRQIEAERRAKDEALDKYVRELNMKITPTGMRRQEDEVFRDKYAQWMNLGKDRQKLNNPQYRMEFEMRGQELRNLIERSKAEEEAKKPLIPLLLDPKKRQELRPEAIVAIDLHDQPLFIKSETGEWIENPNRKRIDISGNLFKSPEFDLPGFRKKVVGEHKPGEIVELDKPFTDKQTGLVYYPAKEKFSKDQIVKMGKDAERFVGESEDNKTYYANRLAGLSLKDYQALDDVYKKYFGGNIGKSPEKLAAAEAAAEAEQFVGKETMKSKLDYEQRQQDKRINISLSQQPSGGAEVVMNDLYGRIWDALDRYKPTKGIWGKNSVNEFMPLTNIPVDAQAMILGYAKELTGLTGSKDGVSYLSSEDVKLKKKDGGIGIYDAGTGKFIGLLPKVGTNMKVQSDVKAKREVVKEGEPTKNTKNKNPLGLDL